MLIFFANQMQKISRGKSTSPLKLPIALKALLFYHGSCLLQGCFVSKENEEVSGLVARLNFVCWSKLLQMSERQFLRASC